MVSDLFYTPETDKQKSSLNIARETIPSTYLPLPYETYPNFNPSFGGYAPPRYGTTYGADVTDYWLLGWQGALQYRMANRPFGGFTRDSVWNPMDLEQNPEGLENYLEFSEELLMTNSKEEYNYVKNRIDEKRKSQGRLQWSDRWSPSILVGLANPLYLVPLPATLGMGVLTGAGRGAAALGGIIAGEELIYHASDPTRTFKESMWHIGSASVMGGLFGGVLGAFGKGWKKGAIGRDGKRIDREHSRKEGRMPDGPWDKPDIKITHNFKEKVKVRKRRSITEKIEAAKKPFGFKDQWKFTEIIWSKAKWVKDKTLKGKGKWVRTIKGINVDTKKIMQQWKEGIKFWTNPIAMGSKRVFKSDEFTTAWEAVQFSIERAYALETVARKRIKELIVKGKTDIKIIKASDKIPAKWIVTKKIKNKEGKVVKLHLEKGNKYVERLEPRADWINRVNDTALKKVNALRTGDSSFTGVISSAFAKTLPEGSFRLAGAIQLEKAFGWLTAWYRGLRISDKIFKGDNYFASKFWEMGYTGVDHNGKFFLVRKPADIHALGMQHNKFPLLNEIFEESYAMFVNGQKRLQPLGVEISNVWTNISNKWTGQAWFKEIMDKPASQWTKKDFNDVFFIQLVDPTFLAGKDTFKIIADATKKWRNEIDDTGKLMSDLGILGSNTTAKRTVAKIRTELFAIQKKYNHAKKTTGRFIDSALKAGAKLDKKTTEAYKSLIKGFEDDIAKHNQKIKELDDFILSARETGFKDLLKDYFPQMWEYSVITKYPQQFKKLLTDYFQNHRTYWVDGKKIVLDSDQAIQKRVKEIFDDIVEMAGKGDIDGNMAWWYRTKKMGSLSYLNHRVINIPQEQLFFIHPTTGEKIWWINNNVGDVMRAYYSRLGPQIAMAQKFGDRHMFGEINRMRTHLMENYIEPLVKKLEKELAKAAPSMRRIKTLEKGIIKYRNGFEDILQELETLKKKALLQFNRADPTSWSEQTASIIKDWTGMSTMGMVMKVAIIDHGTLILNHGFRRVFGNIAKNLIRGTENFSKASKEMRLINNEGNDVLNGTMGSRFVETGGNVVPNTHWFTRLTSNLSRPFYVANLLGPFTVWLKTQASMLASHRLIDTALKLAKGSPVSKGELEFYSRFMDMKMAKAILKEFEAGNIATTKGGKMYWANAGQWKDKDLSFAFRSYVNDSIHSSVVTPRGADRPNWFDGKLKIPKFSRNKQGQKEYWEWDSRGVTLPAQFLSYGMSATSKIMLAGMQRRDATVLQGVIALIGLGYISAAWKDPYFHKKTFTEQTIRAFELTGLMGILNDLNISLETLSGHQLGLRPAFGAKPLFGEVNVGDRLGEPLGPGINLITEALWAFTSEEAKRNDRAAIVRRLIPWNNLWVWNDWFRQASKSIYGTIEEKATE